MWKYLLYGVVMQSNCPIPGLLVQAAAEPAAIGVRIWFAEMPPALAAAAAQTGRVWQENTGWNDHSHPAARRPDNTQQDYFRMVFSDGVEFIINRNGRELGVTWPAQSSVEDAATYLVGPIMAVILALQQITCLHASAVAIGEGAVALLGPSGSGKSTTAAVFARLGYPVLADDLVPLRQRQHRFWAQSGYPGLRLWSDTVSALFGSAEALPLLTPTWDKRYLALTAPAYKFHREELPLTAIYFLDERNPGATAAFQPLAPRAGLLALLANSYVTQDLDPQQRPREFELLSRVARHVPLRRVQPPDDPAHLPELCAAIVRDAGACRAHATPAPLPSHV